MFMITRINYYIHHISVLYRNIDYVSLKNEAYC